MESKRPKLFDYSKNAVLETDVGINMFLNNEVSGFDCILKNRYLSLCTYIL